MPCMETQPGMCQSPGGCEEAPKGRVGVPKFGPRCGPGKGAIWNRELWAVTYMASLSVAGRTPLA